ncbi:hypothetical protein B0T16DRAFT_406878 [Cercophora newfieldiana]|uniref:CENP-V/GFA domain-containing protein n=1 Tax=Cercophora newfieldiana TaxID=92897 RepID=A0AA39YHP6_9PEZI|nr:hypothetical protein B0T16DRAFT_406878 [Cercophora newfieldiana]
MRGVIDGWESRGLDIMPWVITSLRHIACEREGGFPGTQSALREAVDQRDERVGTLKYYEVMPGTQRYFCGRCSATVFLAADEDEEVVKVAVGLLGSPDGAMARSIISWDIKTDTQVEHSPRAEGDCAEGD